RNRIAEFDFSQNTKLTAGNITISPQFLTAKVVKKDSGYILDTVELGTNAANLTVEGVVPAEAAPCTMTGGILTAAAAPGRVVLRGGVTSGTLTDLPVSLIVKVERVIDESGNEVLPEDDAVSVAAAEIGLGNADYIFSVEGGYETVTWNTDDPGYFVVERYDGSKQFLWGKRISTAHLKLSADQDADDIVWGGVYEGEKYNFVVSGQYNNDEEDNRAVVLVAKFSKDWAFLGSCPVCNNSDLNGIGSIEATSVFNYGPVRMSELDGNLWVVSNHIGYTSVGNLRHFGKMSLVVDEETMELKGTAERYMHDYDCYVLRVNDEMYCMDLVEGSRVVTVGRLDLSRYNDGWGSEAAESVVIYEFWTKERVGSTSYSLYGYTGGLEYSETSDRLLAIGYGNDQEKLTASGGDPGNTSSNIWLRLVSPDLKTVEEVSLTSFPDGSGIDASDCSILKMDSNRFLVTWYEWHEDAFEGYNKFMFIDGSGRKLTDPVVLSSEEELSKMILSPDGTVVWRDSTAPGGLASIDTADFDENGHTVYLTFDANGGVLPAEDSYPEAALRTVEYRYENDGSGDEWIYPNPVRKTGKATIFKGWYTDPYDGIKVDGKKLSSYRQTLYAHWRRPPAILSAKPGGVKAKANKRRVTVSWNKPSVYDMNRYGITNFEIQVSTDKDFAAIYKSKKLGKTKKTWKFKGKKKTTYYVRVRYLGEDGASLWSKKAKVRIKK
ncbi:MAG: InlB B-repeat-containing protein, partial [Lachnospiraceae bacterium]|nr:InlB B-repeat-containing protein [Lachnospiraceae bacterium]